MSYTVEIDLSDFNTKIAGFLSALVPNATLAAEATAREAAGNIARGAYWKNRTGDTAKSFDVSTSRLSATVESSSLIASYLEYGTRPHAIAAVNARALSFVWNGSRVSFRSVRHPGTKPLLFVEAEALRSEPLFAAALELAASNAASRSGLS